MERIERLWLNSFLHEVNSPIRSIGLGREPYTVRTLSTCQINTGAKKTSSTLGRCQGE